MKVHVITAIVVTFLATAVGVSFAGSYDHEVKAKNISFAWKIEGDKLLGKMSAKTEGWVAVGFNPSKKMKDANIIIGYVDGKDVKIYDHFGDKATGHSEDGKKGGSEDVTLVGGTEEQGMTTIEFTMPLNSGDKLDGALSLDDDTVLILAYGDRDSIKARHKYRTDVTVNLGTGAAK